MTPGQYDAWYGTPRGRWIGETEYRLLYSLLAPTPRARVIDVGCGTGYFTRRFALDGHRVTGLDPDPSMLEIARARRAAGEHYVRGAYRGAHWHTARNVRQLFSRMPCEGLRLEYAVFLPSGRLLARSAELVVPKKLPFGAFLVAAAESLAARAQSF